MKLIFLHVDKYGSFLQIDTMHFDGNEIPEIASL